jgi:hypothetical protein
MLVCFAPPHAFSPATGNQALSRQVRTHTDMLACPHACSVHESIARMHAACMHRLRVRMHAACMHQMLRCNASQCTQQGLPACIMIHAFRRVQISCPPAVRGVFHQYLCLRSPVMAKQKGSPGGGGKKRKVPKVRADALLVERGLAAHANEALALILAKEVCCVSTVIVTY